MNNDRTCALHIASNPTNSSRTKSIAFSFSFLRELVNIGRITIHHVGTHDMLADVATKHLINNELQLNHLTDQGYLALKRSKTFDRILPKTPKDPLIGYGRTAFSQHIFTWIRC